jgi:3'(2'), 5'-bisphosphate nucleotidase
MSEPLSRSQLEALLGPVLEIAQQAARCILDVYESDFAVSHKDDLSPLTQADLVSHKAICKGLQRLTPEIPILSEEADSIPFEQQSKWLRYWLVDPLDGTKEFVKRNGEFTVNIALVDGHSVALGVVQVPVTNVIYYAARDVGSFKLEPGAEPLKRLQTKKADPSRFVVCGSRSHGSEAVQEFARTLPGSVELISQGSSLKFCLVAEGRADIYPRFGFTSAWDTAAAQCVVEQAGGIVVDFNFCPIAYNTQESIRNPNFLVIADRQFSWRDYVRADLS